MTSSIEPSSAFEYVGRMHYSFLDAEPGSGYMGSYLGALKVFTIGGGVAYEANAVYQNVLPTGAVVNDAYKTNFIGGDRLANITGLNCQKEGWFAKAAWIPPVKLGSQGLLQPYGIYESWEFAHLLGINDQKITQYGGGLNYYVRQQNVRLSAEYLKTEFDTPTGLIGGGVDPTTFAPIDKGTEYGTFRLMLQIVI